VQCISSRYTTVKKCIRYRCRVVSLLAGKMSKHGTDRYNSVEPGHHSHPHAQMTLEYLQGKQCGSQHHHSSCKLQNGGSTVPFTPSPSIASPYLLHMESAVRGKEVQHPNVTLFPSPANVEVVPAPRERDLTSRPLAAMFSDRPMDRLMRVFHTS
jgi:hypothetical protein